MHTHTHTYTHTHPLSLPRSLRGHRSGSPHGESQRHRAAARARTAGYARVQVEECGPGSIGGPVRDRGGEAEVVSRKPGYAGEAEAVSQCDYAV